MNPKLGKMRLADLYCLRGRANTIAKKYDPGAADYERAIRLDVPADCCDCEPYEGVAGTYFEARQYDKAWEAVHRARAKKRWLSPEFIEQLKKASGRDS